MTIADESALRLNLGERQVQIRYVKEILSLYDQIAGELRMIRGEFVPDPRHRRTIFGTGIECHGDQLEFLWTPWGGIYLPGRRLDSAEVGQFFRRVLHTDEPVRQTLHPIYAVTTYGSHSMPTMVFPRHDDPPVVWHDLRDEWQQLWFTMHS